MKAFTLAELMVAIAFICIALFGYISLHLRIIHSSLRLEEHEKIRTILETALVGQLAASRASDLPDGETNTEVTAGVGGNDLSYKLSKRVSHPNSASQLRKLEANLTWIDNYGDHGFHVESFARRFGWGW